MGDERKDTAGELLRRAVVSLAPGGLAERAFNHTAHVVDEIGRAIVVGEYPANTMIPLDPDLEEMFGVSRTVIREAKKMLIAKGMLTSKAKVGTRVLPPADWNMFDPDVLRWHMMGQVPEAFLRELFEIRLIVEPAAAARVAARARAEDAAALGLLCDDLAAAGSRSDFAVADLALHHRILALSGNRFLGSLGNLAQTALYSMLMAEASDAPRSPEELRNVVDSHRAIVAAIAAADPEAAADTMRAVIETARGALFSRR